MPANIAALNRYKREQHGHENNLRALDPPSTNRRPYNTLKIHIQKLFDGGETYELSVEGVVKAMLSQLGMSSQTGTLVVIKVQRIDAFASEVSDVQSAHRPIIEASFSSIVPQLGDLYSTQTHVHYPVLKALSDVGSSTKPARVSYTYPLSMRDTPLNPKSNFNLGSFYTNANELDVYVHVLWSTADVAPPIED